MGEGKVKINDDYEAKEFEQDNDILLVDEFVLDKESQEKGTKNKREKNMNKRTRQFFFLYALMYL